MFPRIRIALKSVDSRLGINISGGVLSLLATLLTAVFSLSSCSLFGPSEIKREFVGVASYYSNGLAGNRTASGDIYDPNRLTAAHRSLPFGTRLSVENLRNRKKVKVVVNDRGPFIRGRVLDLSRRAARKLDFLGDGLAEVRVMILSLPPPR